MCITICNEKNNIIHLNGDSMVKNLFLKYGGEGFKPIHLHPRLMG